MSPLPDERDQVGICTAPCWACQRPFWFWPSQVISIEIDPATGVPPDVHPHTGEALSTPRAVETIQHVICPRCIRDINRERIKRGMEPWRVFDEITLESAGSDEDDAGA